VCVRETRYGYTTKKGVDMDIQLVLKKTVKCKNYLNLDGNK
jgi:hypothetical protein